MANQKPRRDENGNEIVGGVYGPRPHLGNIVKRKSFGTKLAEFIGGCIVFVVVGGIIIAIL